MTADDDHELARTTAAAADGSTLVYNRADPWLPDLLVCRPELAAAVMDVVPEHD